MDWNKLGPLLIFGLFIFLYMPTLSYDFVYEDHDLIVNNPIMDHVWPPTQFFWNQDESSRLLAHPLPNLSLAINKALFGPSAWAFRIINLLLHCLNVLLFWLFLSQFLKPYQS